MLVCVRHPVVVENRLPLHEKDESQSGANALRVLLVNMNRTKLIRDDKWNRSPQKRARNNSKSNSSKRFYAGSRREPQHQCSTELVRVAVRALRVMWGKLMSRNNVVYPHRVVEPRHHRERE